ncbi:MAG: DsbA family protein [Gammaproteobacteria bacterium]|nr:DsbA family protein [Gammaproteobacteria bacterium]MDE0271496.1 DsbA family protein [Gammaproteobacteria bacterium]
MKHGPNCWVAAALLSLVAQSAVADSALAARDQAEIWWPAAESGASPVLGLPAGRVVTVSFLDSKGDPWPMSELVGSGASWLTIRQAAEHPHVAIVQTEAEMAGQDAMSVNLVVLLRGLSEPVHLALEPGVEAAPTAVTVRIGTHQSGSPLVGTAVASHGADFDAAIRDYLLANPQVLREALDPARQLAARVSEHRDALLAAAGVPTLGDLSGGVTVVEFFDYRCGYCKRSLDAVRGLLGADGVRVEMREYPILGDESEAAARAALAAARQGAYEAAHFALMAHEGGFDAAAIESIMGELGLDVEKLTADMESTEVGALIEANRDLAARIGVTGTPAFLALGPGGVEVSPGALDEDRLARMVDAVRLDDAPIQR